MSRSLSALLVCVLLAVTVLGQGLAVAGAGSRPAAGTGVTAESSPVDPRPSIATQQGFEHSTFRIEVFENGSARWTFRFTKPLNDSERDDFETFAKRFESEPTELYRSYRERAIALTRTASNRTGREMAARNFSRSAEVTPLNRGIVEISFIWTNLAVVDGDRVRVADIFQGGFYIGPDQWLVFEAGPGLAFDPARIEPAPTEYSGTSTATSETLTWKGEQQFTSKHPRVVLGPEGQARTTTTAATTQPGGTGSAGTTTSAGGATQSGGSFPMLLVALAVLVVGLGAGAAWRSGALGSTGTPDDDPGGASADTAGGETASAGTAGAESASTETARESAEPAVTDEELLTDEDRVIQMLEANGGRMKQANIVDETGWSKSKVSMLLSDMEDEDEISKLRVGRENIVSLKGHEPDAAGSPFEDDS